MRMFIRFLVLAAGFILARPGGALDWPEFRGPDGQGHALEAKDLPWHWGAGENIAWRVDVPGRGWSSPILYRDRIYLTSALSRGDDPKADRSLQAFCFEARSGRKIWQTELFLQDGASAPNIHTKNGHASPTPLARGDRLFVHFGHQGTACLDLEGRVIWRNATLKYTPVHGNGGSPIVVDDLLVFSCDGAEDPFIVALDQKSGEVRWRTPRQTSAGKRFSFSTPLLIEYEGQRQILSPGSGVLSALDPRDGRELWRVRYGEGYSVIPRPVFGQGLVFIATGYNRPTVMAIRPGGRGDVTDSHVVWTINRSAPHTPSLLLVGEELYMVSDAGVASCMDAKTGAVHWQERVGGNYSASPLYADGRIYLQNEAGKAVVLKPGKVFEKMAENDLGERTLASYAVGDKALFIRAEEHLYRVQRP